MRRVVPWVEQCRLAKGVSIDALASKVDIQPRRYEAFVAGRGKLAFWEVELLLRAIERWDQEVPA